MISIYDVVKTAKIMWINRQLPFLCKRDQAQCDQSTYYLNLTTQTLTRFGHYNLIISITLVVIQYCEISQS